MDAARFISRRLRFKGKMAMVSIAVSFLVMIFAVAVTSGFRSEIRKGLSEAAGDIILVPRMADYTSGQFPLKRDYPFLDEVRSMRAVQSISPAVYRSGVIKTGREIGGAVFKGVPDMPDTLGAIVPSSLASKMGLSVGDRLPSYFIGENVKVRNFRVSGTYPNVLGSEDAPVVYVGLGDMQRLCGWEEDEVSALEISVAPGFRGRAALSEITAEIGSHILMHSSEDDDRILAMSLHKRYPQVFSWLDLIDFNVLVLLILMTIVAGFNMISGLLILLFRNISTIGTLKSMGMTDRSISRLFLHVASNLVLKGMAIGNALALTLCLVQWKWHVVKLDPANYFLSYVPVSVNVPSILLADLLAWAAIMLLLTLPCLFISSVDPAKTVRAQ